MQACKDGFKASCRPIICLDGCHLKGYHGGHLLTAVGIDANDCIYPIAFAAVESECHSSWCWHLYNNFKGKHKGNALKDSFWKATTSTYMREFQVALAEMESLSPKAFEWLKNVDPKFWSKSHFLTRSKCDMLLNNLCESFNKCVLEARSRPIITMLEGIRTKIMQRVAKKKVEADKWTDVLCPKFQKKLEAATEMSNRCWPTHAGGNIYQVACGAHNQYGVNLEAHTCSCRKWDLTGIPCPHAISVILMREHRPESYVDDCYKTKTQQAIYSHMINPVRGPNQWIPHESSCMPILPPPLKRPPGKPHKNKRKEADETTNPNAKVSRKGLIMKCRKCGECGHNVRTCKGKVGGNRFVNYQTQASTETRQPKLLVKRSFCGTTKECATNTTAPTEEAPQVQQPSPIELVRWMIDS
ncbi:hypothetical protein GQ457_04G013760 [Hibiscus cannabinus]